MTLLLRGVTVLLLTFTACDTSLDSVTLELLEKCQDDPETLDFLDQICNITEQISDLSQEEVESCLSLIMYLTTCEITDAPDQTTLRSLGNKLLQVNENLVSNLVKETDTYSNISFSVQNLEVQVFMIGPNVTLNEIPTLITSYASLYIDLIGISEETDGSAAVVFMSYTNMTDIFKPSLFDTDIISKKSLMSAVISFSLPQTFNTWILETIDFTVSHIKELDPRAILSCLNWEINDWPSCFISQTNRTHSVCSCYYGTTFALISETEPCMVNSTEYCEEDFLYRMLDYIYSIEQLPQEAVEHYLNTTLNLITHGEKQSASLYFGDILLEVNEMLLYILEKQTDTYNSISISLQTLEVQVFVVGPNVTLSKIPTLITSNASLDIDITGISDNQRSTYVAFMSYTTLGGILEPYFSDQFDDSIKTIISTVVKTTTFNLLKGFTLNYTLKHVIESVPEGILSCVHRDWYMWDTGYCTVTQTNSTHTVCSCNQLIPLALFVLTIPCRDNVTVQCAMRFLDQIRYNTAEHLPQKLVTLYFNMTVNLMSHVKDVASEENDLISFANKVLEVTEKLVFTLMEKTDNISLQNLDVQVIVAGPNVTFFTSHASLDITRFSENNQVPGSVAFVSYTNMSDILKPAFFKTIINTNKTLISPVVSVLLPQTTKTTQLTKSIKITFMHTSVLEPEFSLSCVYWKEKEWLEDGCEIIQTNSSHTVCSCNRLNTFALIMETDPCRVNLTESCIKNFLNQISAQELPQKVVERYLNITINLLTRLIKQATDKNILTYYGNAVLVVNEKLVSTLVTKSHTNNISITLQHLEVVVSMVEAPVDTVNNISQLKTSNAFMDIDLIGISRNNKGSAAVAFMNYAGMAEILKPSNTEKTMISTVVSATLPKTPNTWFTQPVNITFKHTKELDPEGRLYCVYWMDKEWVEIGCAVLQINSTHTMCSCNHLSVFALIMEVVPCKKLFGATLSLHCNPLLDMSIAQGVGVFFLSLCLLSFDFCCQDPNKTNTAIINLCLNLLMFHLLNLLKPLFQPHLRPPQACAIVNGIRWFFFISAFVWMFIETVLLFLFLKNKSQIRSNLGQGIMWKWLNMIGYLIPPVVVIVCAVVQPQQSINEECWGSKDIDMIFVVPVLFIVASNVLLFIIIITMMIFTLKQLRNQSIRRRNRNDTDLMMRVMFKSLAQFIILGCYWILQYIPSDNAALYNVFLFLNSQQGTFIFIVHCLLNQEVRQKYRKFLCDIFCFKSLGTTTEVEQTHETQH
ncbi:uncharacterized protein LOC128601681 isoform X1 [Ictalurus furcatus]|uniref:uncharacterized protein LOC128601681 isoform X1 n=1 Tax=Ictalurus furcatus TaxID=66913 RepID=UPI002350998E|nr:uncharacterized protein LOC128601681 isoform X1 [Ictalurus furcatus]